MKQKVLALFLLLLLLCSLCVPAWAGPLSGPGSGQMAWAQEKGVLIGTSPNTLAPDVTATRAMAVTMLYRYAGSPAVENAAPFVDVPGDAYYADSIAWAAQTGIAAGKKATAFCPHQAISREDFAVMLYRLYTARHGVPEISPDILAEVEDAGDIHEYARDAMAWAAEALVLKNNYVPTDPLFPQVLLTRGALAHLLRQYDALVEGNPAQLYRFDPDEIEKIAVILRHQGFSDQINFLITDPAEIQRFVEKINGFSYTDQHTPAGAGGFSPYYALVWFKEPGILPSGLHMYANKIGEFSIDPAPDQPYFTLEWFQSFQETSTKL